MDMKEIWNGRLDSWEKCDLRIWQIVKDIKDFDKNDRNHKFAFIGYDTDEGVKRNLGRPGAAFGPDEIRKGMKSLPVPENTTLYDYQNLNKHMTEEAQEEYSQKVKDALEKDIFPLGLGGGHDIVFGTYTGIRKTFPGKKIGIISFDAHLDNRPYDKGRTSGTSFKEILDTDKNVKYAIVGFQKAGNTKRLIDTATSHGVLMIPEELDEIRTGNYLHDFIKKVDIVYITFCMDVFDAAIAPGVSAPTPLGLDGKKGKRILLSILNSQKTVAADFAEVNPLYDIDGRTAKLTGRLIYETINCLIK